MPRDYGYIPRTSYDAHNALAGEDSRVLGHATVMRLYPGMYGSENTITVAYRGLDILRYWPDGTVEVTMWNPYTPGVLNRVRRVLPVGWAIRPARRPHRPPIFVYRDAYEVTYETPFGFLPGGGFRLNGYGTYTQEEIDRIADERTPTLTPYDDAAHRRARARTRRVREDERVHRMSTPPAWPPPPLSPAPPMADRGPLSNVAGGWYATDPCLDDLCTCGSTWGAHYGETCPVGGRYWEPAPCECQGRITGEGSVHGPYACFAPTTPESRAEAWLRAQEWLRPALATYNGRPLRLSGLEGV